MQFSLKVGVDLADRGKNFKPGLATLYTGTGKWQLCSLDVLAVSWIRKNLGLSEMSNVKTIKAWNRGSLYPSQR